MIDATFALLPLVVFFAEITALAHVANKLPPSSTLRLPLAIFGYLLHGAAGIAAVIYFQPVLAHTSAAAFGAVLGLFGWIGLGLRELLRLIPVTDRKPKPEWMLHVGAFDIACLLAVGGGLALCTTFGSR